MFLRTLTSRAWSCVLLLVACSSTEGAKSNGSQSAPSEGHENDGQAGVWVWHDVDGAICANGSPTGLGVNRGTDDRVIVYLSGGSACLDEDCKIGTPSMRRDGGFGAAQLEECASSACDGGQTFPLKSIFDRTAATNPFAKSTYVFISNCAGDYYVGDNDYAFPSWTARFHGSRNQALFAAWVARTYPTASRVVLSGGSAGSIGAMLNYWQWVKAFPKTRVDLISDSLAFVFVDRPEWRYDLHRPQAPAGCDTCVTDYRTIYAFNAGLSPSSRIAMVDSENNWTLNLTNGGHYAEGLEALQPRLDELSNLRYYVANGKEHVLLKHPLESSAIAVTREGETTKTLGAFLGEMQSDDPAWKSASCLGP